MKIALIVIGVVVAVIAAFSLIVNLIGKREERRMEKMEIGERRKYVEGARKAEIV